MAPAVCPAGAPTADPRTVHK